MEHNAPLQVLRDLPGYGPETRLPVTDRGDWLATTTGGMWSIDHPHPLDVKLQDIAWGLSRACRYNGQLKPGIEIYSVSEHSVLMTVWAIENDCMSDGVGGLKPVDTFEDAMAILMHDASEALFGDMPTPLKKRFPDFKEMEDRAQGVMIQAMGLSGENTRIVKSEIKAIDKRIRVDERYRMIAEPALSEGLRKEWDEEPDLKPLEIAVPCLLPSQACEAFLSCYAWIVENLPARDLEAKAIAIAHLEELGEPVAARLPVMFEICENPFEDVLECQ